MTDSQGMAGGSPAPGNPEVDVYMSKLAHPLKREIEEVRALILNAGMPLTELIKWNAPNYSHDGEDRLTFNLHGKRGGFRLVFHCGAKVRAAAGKARLIDDDSGLLEWASGDRAIVQFNDANDVSAKKDQLAPLIRKWMEAAI